VFGINRHSAHDGRSFHASPAFRLGKAIFELGMEIQGPYGPVTDPERSPDSGRWVLGLFVSFANTIAGGSSEIQRNIIAQRVLGLPRS